MKNKPQEDSRLLSLMERPPNVPSCQQVPTPPVLDTRRKEDIPGCIANNLDELASEEEVGIVSIEDLEGRSLQDPTDEQPCLQKDQHAIHTESTSKGTVGDGEHDAQSTCTAVDDVLKEFSTKNTANDAEAGKASNGASAARLGSHPNGLTGDDVDLASPRKEDIVPRWSGGSCEHSKFSIDSENSLDLMPKKENDVEEKVIPGSIVRSTSSCKSTNSDARATISSTVRMWSPLDTPHNKKITEYSAKSSDEEGTQRSQQPKVTRQITTHSQEDDRNLEADLQEVQARTMYKMVEDIGLKMKHKLLFLTNAQADLLATTPGGIKKIFDAFDIPEASLMINLHLSPVVPNCPHLPGKVEGREPFASPEDAADASESLMAWMQDVLLPLACETRAVILCSANEDDCLLSTAFSKVLALQRGKWHNDMPFTVLATSSDLAYFYESPEEYPHWRAVRRKSKHWKAHDKNLYDLVIKANKEKSGDDAFWLDLDPNCPNYILVDGVDVDVDSKRRKLHQSGAYSKLMSSLIAYWKQFMPVITIKAGSSMRPPNYGSHIVSALEKTKGGSPLVLLDTRRRAPSQTAPTNRIDTLTNFQAQFNEHCDSLLDEGVAEVLDVACLAWLHESLYGDGDSLTSDISRSQFDNRPVPIWKLLDKGGREERIALQLAGQKPANSEQIVKNVRLVVERLYQDAWKILSKEEREAKGREAGGETYSDVWGDQMQYYRTVAIALMKEPTVHHMSTKADVKCGQQFLRSISQLDDLPPYESFEGLRLLRECWNDYDVTMWYAGQNKIKSIVLYACLLIIGFMMVTFPSLASSDCCGFTNTEASKIVIGLSIGQSFLISVTAFVNPDKKWRQLRGAARSLESIIWRYRTRVDDFKLQPQNPSASQQALCSALEEWRDTLLDTDMLRTSFLKDHQRQAPHVYKHFQYRGSETLEKDKDDFHSPVKPEVYVERRLQPQLDFYQARIPKYIRRRYFYNMLCIASSAVCMALGYLEAPSYAAMVSSAGAAVVSWMQFTDVDRKLERYSSTIRRLRNMRMRWMSLLEVEKASKERITFLITRCESIIMDEFCAWAAASQDRQDRMEARSATPAVQSKSVVAPQFTKVVPG